MTSPTDELPTLPTGYRWSLFEKRMGSYGDCFGLRIQQKRTRTYRAWMRSGKHPESRVVCELGTRRFLFWRYDGFEVEHEWWETVAEMGPSYKTLIELRLTASIVIRDAWARGHDLEEARAVLR